MRGIEFKHLQRIEGPVVITRRSRGVGFGEMVAVYGRDGGRRLGQVVDLGEDLAAIQIFGSTTGLSADGSRLEFLDRPMELRIGPGLLGRVFDGLGRPIDGYGEIFPPIGVISMAYP